MLKDGNGIHFVFKQYQDKVLELHKSEGVQLKVPKVIRGARLVGKRLIVREGQIRIGGKNLKLLCDLPYSTNLTYVFLAYQLKT